MDRCAAAASKAPALVELYRETITGVDYASLSPKAREKALPSYSIRGVPNGFVRGKRVVAIDDTRMYAACPSRTSLRQSRPLSASEHL